MRASNTDAFIAIDGSFIVFIDCEFDKKPASFVLHAEGNMRSIVRLFREAESHHILYKDIYFEMNNAPYFKNHAELVSCVDGVNTYKFINFIRRMRKDK